MNSAAFKHWTSLGLLSFSLSCSTPPKTSEEPTAPLVQEPPLSPAGQLYFKDQSCPRPYSVRQGVVDLSDKDKTLPAKTIWAMPGRVVRVQQLSGDSLVQRQLEREGQFFEEIFQFGYYSQPFRSIRLASEKASYTSTLRLSFDNKALATGEAIAIGQLFKTGGNETTKVILTLPDGKKVNEVFEWIQTAAAEQRIDHDASLDVKVEGSQLQIENSGPRGSSSGFLILQLKAPLESFELQIQSSRKWPSGAADAIELAFAEKRCLAEAECKGVKAVTHFQAGLGAQSGADLGALSSQLRDGAAPGSGAGSAIALGRGGVIELEMDGPLLNHESSDLRIESLDQPVGCPQPAQRIRVFAKEKPEHLWQAIDREKALCFTNNIDLQTMHMARFIKIEDVSASKSPRGFELSKIKCLERPKLEAP